MVTKWSEFIGCSWQCKQTNPELSAQFDSNVVNWCVKICEDDKKRKIARIWQNTDLFTVVLCELGEKPASLLGLEISQHGGDDGADVFWEKQSEN